MVCVIGPSVVLKSVNPAHAHAADRTPCEIPKIHDQVGGYTTHRAVDLLWFEYAGAKRLTFMILHGLELGLNFIAHRFIICRINNPLRLARSEEHTSDSSHPSISYAVFCLKKKKNNKSNKL